jgi:hypothetical protein
MTKRTVAQPLTSYVGADGSVRYAAAGDEVDVHADHVKRFDAVDSTAQERTEAQQDATPKQPAKKATTAKRRAGGRRAWFPLPLSRPGATLRDRTSADRPFHRGLWGRRAAACWFRPHPPAFITPAGRVRRRWW